MKIFLFFNFLNMRNNGEKKGIFECRYELAQKLAPMTGEELYRKIQDDAAREVTKLLAWDEVRLSRGKFNLLRYSNSGN